MGHHYTPVTLDDRRRPTVEAVVPIPGLRWRLIGLLALFVLLGAAAQWVSVHEPWWRDVAAAFDVTREAALHAWIAAALALATAVLLRFVARLERTLRRGFGVAWRMLGLAFLIASIAFVLPVRDWLTPLVAALPPAYREPAWLFVDHGAGMLLVLAVLPTLGAAATAVRWRLLAGTLLVALAWPLLAPWQGEASDPTTLGGVALRFGLVALAAESLRLVGLVLVLDGALLHLRTSVNRRLGLRLSRHARGFSARLRSAEAQDDGSYRREPALRRGGPGNRDDFDDRP